MTAYLQVTTGKLHTQARCSLTVARHSHQPLQVTAVVAQAVADGTYTWCQRCASGPASTVLGATRATTDHLTDGVAADDVIAAR